MGAALSRSTSTTPTPGNLSGNVPISPSIGHWDNMAGPSRNGKNRRIEPYSDEETGADEDVPMGGQGFTQQDGRQAGVNSVPFEAYFRKLIFP
jgi:hypothetical protein